MASGATLAVMVGGASDWNSGASDDIGTLLGNTAFAGGSSLGIDTTDAYGGFTYGGTIADTATGPLGLVVLGENTLTLTAANTYTGGTVVTAGTLEAQSPASLPGYSTPGEVSVASGATLAVMVGGASDWNSGASDDIVRAFRATPPLPAARRWASTPATATSVTAVRSPSRTHSA